MKKTFLNCFLNPLRNYIPFSPSLKKQSMKTIIKFLLFIIVSSTFVSCLCWTGNCGEPPLETFKPVFVERSVFENSLQIQPPQNITKSGKIYIKDNLMFLNDTNKGFHVYNYTNPETPVKLGFIKIIGATDLAIRDNIIYINQAIDLVTLSYNNTSNTIQVLHRNKNVFPQKLSPNGNYAYEANENKIVIDWIK
jgi:hypothetical protein